MARTALFSRLSRVLNELGATHGPPATAHAPNIARRRLLSAAAGIGLGACGPQSNQVPLTPVAPRQRVAVIGAGLAGLHCAYRLHQANVDVTVYEANGRVGGRTFTGRRLFRDNPKLTCELGGEFFGGDHTAMRALVREFMIPTDERYGSAEAASNEVFWLGGKEVPEATLVSQLAQVAPVILSALSAADSDASVFRDLDNTTLASFLEQHVPPDEFPELSPLLFTAFRGEFGLEPDEQSALNLVHLTSPDNVAGSAVFGNAATETRVRLGNDTIATQLAAPLQLRDRLKLNSRLASIRLVTSSSGNTFSLTFATQAVSGFVAEVEHVVFAIPFSVLRQLDLSTLMLSDQKSKVIRELGYGTHSKLLGAVKRRIWLELYQKSGTVTSDLPFQQVWDASINQTDQQGVGILMNLAGGEQGARDQPVPESMAALLADLNGAFPGVSGAFIAGSALRMHWPSAPLFRGSYSSYRPGQWALRGHEGRREGNVHFCGEHCSVDFQGRMEGAAETGALVAARLLDDLHIAWPSGLAELLAPKLLVEQPCYHGTTGAKLGFLERHTVLARQALPDKG